DCGDRWRFLLHYCLADPWRSCANSHFHGKWEQQLALGPGIRTKPAAGLHQAGEGRPSLMVARRNPNCLLRLTRIRWAQRTRPAFAAMGSLPHGCPQTKAAYGDWAGDWTECARMVAGQPLDILQRNSQRYSRDLDPRLAHR